MNEADIQVTLSGVVSFLILIIAISSIWRGIKVVPQSEEYTIERFGKYTKTLNAGLNFIVPFLDQISRRISILERQLPEFTISVITKDNVEVKLKATVFYRVVDAAKSVYRIQDVDLAIDTEATSIVRSAAGRLDLDDLQSSRESMNEEIGENLQKKASEWGLMITSTAITDVLIDEQTKEAQRQQLNAEREKRASIAAAEGSKRSVELAADAVLYEADKKAEAIRITADAEAYAVKVKAGADAEQTRLVAQAIADNGQPAVDYEIMKRQVQAMSEVAAADNAKTVILPTNITQTLGAFTTVLETLGKK
ncbi:SPFH/Band 7/PHB domain protein [Pseudomonadales bacterium]|nr:SPFH/Band 7/PHB domain protein [Pseudomonadales bacterium]MDA8789608.1 SPFH/Band 7/PHB domain protein [Pseudomonadales bacterium]MDB4408390.1 SPFH/Band 7/PHB domain protein [bacterium]MDB4825137.1 SPFH/Band 7/PHB domain protein [Pseudomonadales bacterium]